MIESRDQSTQSGERDVVFETNDVNVRFDMDRGTSRVLSDVSMDVYRDEVLGIVGESGSGKSMFASALLDAVVAPGELSGEITYYRESGTPVDILGLSEEELRQFRWEEVSMVFQGAMSSFNPVQDIETHFRETLDAHDKDIQQGLEHARELLSNLYLDPDRVFDSYAHELSGGMRQRALIALSLLLKPDVLVMDEPTAALDLLMQRSIINLIDDLQAEYDLTIVFISHDLPIVAGIADRIAVMYAFQFAEVGPAEEIISNPTHPYTRSLLKAVPNLDAPLAEMRPIEGSAPDPVNVPSGCSYHPRCSLATGECRTEDPPFYPVSGNHDTACHHWEDAEEAIPLSFESDAEDMRIEGSQSEEPVLVLDDVSVHFETGSQGIMNLFKDPDIVRAVDDVDLEIYDNDVVALVGESGCGKTTLGKTAVGLQDPTEGTIEFRGQDIHEADKNTEVSAAEIQKALQIIHQDPGSSLNPNQLIRTSIGIPMKKWYPDMSKGERYSRVLSLLETVNMEPPEDYANRYPHQLSGGEKQRVALVRSLLTNPEVILADEAVSALDVSLRIEIMDLMLQLQEEFDTSYLFISHNLSNSRYLAGRVGGRVAVMYLGEIVEIGPAEEVIQNPKHPYTKVLKWATASLKDANENIGEPPLRTIDIPDASNPPEGCRFHTRCPEAREICKERDPELRRDDEEHVASCFREYGEDHPYWDSPPIEEFEIEIDEIEAD